MLELEALVKHYYGTDEPVRAVDGVSLAVEAGETIAIQGPSGSGKTTLLLLIAGLLEPEGGVVRFAGREVSSFSEQDLSEYLMHDVGFIYQRYQLMPHVSTVENAALKLLLSGVGMREARARVLPWLQRLGLGDRLGHTPEQLSGGERQRVSIARALASEPRLILADEPTGNLDSSRSESTVRLLRELALEQGAAVVLVTHDAEAAAIAERRYSLRDGRLRQEAPSGARPEQLARAPAVDE